MKIHSRLFEIEADRSMLYVRVGRADACWARDGSRLGRLSVGRWFVW